MNKLKSILMKQVLWLFVMSLSLLVASCNEENDPVVPTPPKAPKGTLDKTMEHEGMTREYIIHVPESYKPDLPTSLLLCFHGYTNTAKFIMEYSNFNDIADTENFIVVYPQGNLLKELPWKLPDFAVALFPELALPDQPHWNVGGWTAKSTSNDVGFTDALLDTISSIYNINPKRIYSTGMSNGGYMSFQLACQLSDRIAAIASVTGSMSAEMNQACDPQRPIPILQLHGDNDALVPYLGNLSSIFSWATPINDVLTYWATFNKTKLTPSVSEIPDIDMTDGSKVELHLYESGTNNVVVKHYKVLGGAHNWFGARGNMDINASMIVWDFLSQYNLDGKIPATNQ